MNAPSESDIPVTTSDLNTILDAVKSDYSPSSSWDQVCRAGVLFIRAIIKEELRRRGAR